jgi:hypothetical protein
MAPMNRFSAIALACLATVIVRPSVVWSFQDPEFKREIVSGPLDQSGPSRLDFEKAEPGRLPEGFRSEVGRWEVVQDDKNRVLAQLASSPDDTFNVCLVQDSRCRNVDLRVRLKADAGELDRGGGVVWRAKDAKNYYIARYNPLEDNFRVYKVENGKRTQFASAKVPGDTKWHTLRITMFDDKITCYLDGVKHLEVEDKTFRAHGMVGLWSKADARSYFDDLAYAAYE